MADDFGVAGAGMGDMRALSRLWGAPLEGDSSRSANESSSGVAFGFEAVSRPLLSLSHHILSIIPWGSSWPAGPSGDAEATWRKGGEGFERQLLSFSVSVRLMESSLELKSTGIRARVSTFLSQWGWEMR